MMPPPRDPAAALAQRLRRARIVPVVRLSDGAAARALTERLLIAGLDTIELTTTIAGWSAAVSEIRQSAPNACIGVGTITGAEQARQAISAGADFCVSPRVVAPARAVLCAAGLPFIEGGLTPTEVLDAASRGIAKLFPGHVGGPQYLRSLLAVAAQARIVATGSIPLAQVNEWLSAGALAVGVGSDLSASDDIATSIERALKS